MGFLDKIFGDFNAKEVKKIEKTADKVMALEGEMEALTDEELRGKTEEFKKRFAEGESLDDMLVEAFAVCREAAWRSLGMKHFKVQVIGGIVLHEGRISEMKTGEGKTLVATLAAYLNALSGKGVHVVTVNDYLAKRDMEWMGKLYTFLGLTVGCVIHGISDKTRKAAYQADITYGTNNEFGFDYLRDNMVNYEEELTQRPLNFAIVDEVDSILIDEARTPLIISGKGEKSTDLYGIADKFVRTLKKEQDYTVDEKDSTVSLTEEGVSKTEEHFKIDNFSDPENMELNHHVNNALRAHSLMQRDIDYIVRDGEIIIVDEFTGRLMFGRRYSNGLHQAIEAKEGLRVRSESKTLATITLQNYFRMYQKLAGMTGTAKTEEDEFREIYNMDVVIIPTNKPVIRNDMEDAVYPTLKGKFNAIVDRIVEIHETGQPVLVGTISIENSELISGMLKRRGVKHNVLNAKQHEREAEIVAQAGRLGQVTIATNMAGRGTDIILGGNPDFEARAEMEKEGYESSVINFATGFVATDDEELLAARAKYHELLEKYRAERSEEQQQVRELGGLAIIGSERHESRRIDNQLRGRSGRQGDPGQTQFFISLEDELMRLFGGERVKGLVDKMGVEEDEQITAGMLSRSIENAQKKVEGRNFGIRKYVLQYDNVMNKQREIIYGERHKVLTGENLREYIRNMTNEWIESVLGSTTADSRNPEEWDLEAAVKSLRRISNKYTGKALLSADKETLNEETLKEIVETEFEELYKEKEAEIGEENMRELERMILLRVVDNLWMDHIDAMAQLKQGIGLRGIGQQDPAAAYAHEGFEMFEALIGEIKEQVVMFCYNVTVETRSERRNVIGKGEGKLDDSFARDAMAQADAESGQGAAGAGGNAATRKQARPEKAKPVTYRREGAKIGRNDPCPCGSGKKYKNCCMNKPKDMGV